MDRGVDMKMKKFFLRCYAQKEANGQWVACCLDFCLAAQADSFEDARTKLDDMIKIYIEEAFTIDKANAYNLLVKRKAPISEWIKYFYHYSLINYVQRPLRNFIQIKNNTFLVFFRVLRELAPQLPR